MQLMPDAASMMVMPTASSVSYTHLDVYKRQRYDHALQNPRQVEIAQLAARGRASGMPRLRVANESAWLVWTDVQSGQPIVRGASVH